MITYNLLLTICPPHVMRIYFVIDLKHTYTKNKNLITIYPFDIQFYLLALRIPRWNNYPKPDDNINPTYHGSFAT